NGFYITYRPCNKTPYSRLVKIFHFELQHVLKKVHPKIPYYILSQKVGKIDKTELKHHLQQKDPCHQGDVVHQDVDVLRNNSLINGHLQQIRAQNPENREQDCS